MRADLRGAAGARRAHPDRRMRLLDRARPDIDGAMMEEAALMAERAVVMGPAFLDQIERLPMPLVHAHRIAVGRQHLIGHAAHEAGFEAAVREHVDHRHFLGDAHRLAAVGDRIAEDQKPRLLAQARQRREHQRRCGIDAGRRLMMLVEHDLDALLLGDQPFVDIAVVKRRALLRIVDAIGQRHADRGIAVGRRQIGIGGLAEMPGSHLTLPKNFSTAAVKAAGCSSCGTWPAALIVCRRAFGRKPA